MASLLPRHHPLSSGMRVRLRPPHVHDARRLPELAFRAGAALGRGEAAGVLRYDPRRRAVACASVLTPEGEALVGVGAIERREGASPDLLLVDPALGDEVRELLAGVLRERAGGERGTSRGPPHRPA